MQKDLNAAGIAALVAPADLTDEPALPGIVQAALERFGQIGVLVNNAGMAMGGRLQDHDPERLRQMVQLNVYSAIRLSQLVLPKMLKQRHGQIVNLTSTMGGLAAPGGSAYAATRAALLGFRDGLRREVAAKGVRFQPCCPAGCRRIRPTSSIGSFAGW